MQFPTRKQKILIALAIYLAAVVLSVSLLTLKLGALRFHPRDYNYFVEQAARLTDPRLANSYALQIEGYNFLGLQGVEGVKSLYHAIHAEYFRYLYVLLYGIFRDPLALYILYSLVFFSPILYFALMPYPNEREHLLLLILFSLLYILFPATINSVSADLRPRVLYVAALSLAVLSIYFDRPFWEKLLFFILVVGIREEGIIFGAVITGLNYIKMEGRSGRRYQTIVFIVIDLIALVLFLAFMRWGGFTRIDNVYNPLNFVRLVPIQYLIGTLIIVAVAAFGLWYTRKKNYPQYQNLLFVLCYSLLIALSGFELLRATLRWYTRQSLASSVSFYDFYINTITNETKTLVFYLLILLGVILWGYMHGRWRKIFVAALCALIALFTVTTLIYYSPIISEWRANVNPARLVWNFAGSHDRYHTKVMLDYPTYQAFYNYDQVIVYNRLPVWDTLPEKRNYPENKNALVKQLQKGIDYAVISRESLGNVLELAELAGIPATEIGANESYVVIQFEKIP